MPLLMLLYCTPFDLGHDVLDEYEQSFALASIPYLCTSASGGGISNSPRGLLPCAKLGLLKDLNEYWEDVGINDILKG